MDFLDIDFSSVIKSGFDYVMYNFIHKALYMIEILVCMFIDWLQDLFNIFAGVETVKYGNDDNFIINVFFENSTISGVFLGMAAIGVTFTFIFSLIAVIRKIFDVDDKMKSTYGQILRNMFRSILIILCLHLSMTVVISFTNALMTSVTKVFDHGEEFTQEPHIDFTDEQYAAMARIFNTIGNYSLNPSYKNRYNLNTCYNEIRGDLRYLADTGVFDFYYETKDANGKTVNTWQSVLQDIAAAANYNAEAPVDVYNEAIANSLSRCITVMNTDPSFHALESYDRTYTFKDKDIDLGRMVFLIGTMGIGKTAAARNEVFNKAPKFTDQCRMPYYYGIKDVYDLDQVNQDFDISYEKTNYIVVYFSCTVLILNMGIIIISCIVRIFNLLFLYIVAPPIIGIMPLDDGQKFRQWLTAFIIQAFSVFATVISMRLFLIFVPIIMSPSLELSDNIYLDMLGKLIAVWAGVIAVQRANGLLTGILADSAGQQSLFAGDVGNDVRGKMISAARGALGAVGSVGKLGLQTGWKLGKGTVKTGWRTAVGAKEDNGERGFFGTLRNKGLLGGLYEGAKTTGSWVGDKVSGSGGAKTDVNKGASASFLNSSSGGKGASAGSLINSGSGSGNAPGPLASPPPARKNGNIVTQAIGAGMGAVGNVIGTAGQLAGETVNNVTGTNAGDLISTPANAVNNGLHSADEAMNGSQNNDSAQQSNNAQNTDLPRRNTLSSLNSGGNNGENQNNGGVAGQIAGGIISGAGSAVSTAAQVAGGTVDAVTGTELGSAVTSPVNAAGKGLSNAGQTLSGNGQSSTNPPQGRNNNAANGGNVNANQNVRRRSGSTADPRVSGKSSGSKFGNAMSAVGRGTATGIGYGLQGVGAVASTATDVAGSVVKGVTGIAGEAINEVTGTKVGNIVSGAGELTGEVTKGVGGAAGGAVGLAGKGMKALGKKSEEPMERKPDSAPSGSGKGTNTTGSVGSRPDVPKPLTNLAEQNSNVESPQNNSSTQSGGGLAGNVVSTGLGVVGSTVQTAGNVAGSLIGAAAGEEAGNAVNDTIGAVGRGISSSADAPGDGSGSGQDSANLPNNQSHLASNNAPAEGGSQPVTAPGSSTSVSSTTPSSTSGSSTSRTPSVAPANEGNGNAVRNSTGNAGRGKGSTNGTVSTTTGNGASDNADLPNNQSHLASNNTASEGGSQPDNTSGSSSSGTISSGSSSSGSSSGQDKEEKGFWGKLGSGADTTVKAVSSAGVSLTESVGGAVEDLGDWLFDVHDNKASGPSVPQNEQNRYQNLKSEKKDEDDEGDDDFEFTPPPTSSTPSSTPSNTSESVTQDKPSSPPPSAPPPLVPPPPPSRPVTGSRTNNQSILNDLAENVSDQPPRNQNTNRNNT